MTPEGFAVADMDDGSIYGFGREDVYRDRGPKIGVGQPVWVHRSGGVTTRDPALMARTRH